MSTTPSSSASPTSSATPGEPPTLRSRRPLTLRFSIPIARTHQFWDSLGEGKFITTRCTDCGHVTFPPQADCPRCMSGEHEWVDFGTEGELLTFTQVQITPTSFVEHDPYVVAIGKFKEGLNVLAWLEGATVERLRPGAKIKLEARKAKDESPYYVFVLTA